MMYFYILVPPPIKFEDIAEFKIDVRRLLIENGFDPDEYLPGKASRVDHCILLVITCILFLLLDAHQ